MFSILLVHLLDGTLYTTAAFAVVIAISPEILDLIAPVEIEADGPVLIPVWFGIVIPLWFWI